MNENNLNIELFHSPGARSDRVKMLLELMEFPYELTIIDLVQQENKRAEYLAVNPLGVVPGLRINGIPVAETAAQLMCLADMDSKRRFSPHLDHPDRLAYTQWMIMLPASLEPMVLPLFRSINLPGARSTAMAAIDIQSKMFVGPYCLGGRLTALDVAVHWSMRHLERFGLLGDQPQWIDYMSLVGEQLDWDNLNH